MRCVDGGRTGRSGSGSSGSTVEGVTVSQGEGVVVSYRRGIAKRFNGDVRVLPSVDEATEQHSVGEAVEQVCTRCRFVQLEQRAHTPIDQASRRMGNRVNEPSMTVQNFEWVALEIE